MIDYDQSRPLDRDPDRAWSRASLVVAACNVKQELLAPQNPGLIDPSAVANAGGSVRAEGRRGRQR